MESSRAVFLRGLLQIADPKIWVASTVPMFVGAAIAWSFTRPFRPAGVLWFLLAAIAVYLVETAKNALNEVVDYLSGVDPGVDEPHRTPFSGGKKTIVQGKLDLTQNAYIAFFCFLAAAVIGVAIILFAEPNVFWIGLIGFVLSVIYSLPPFKLCYKGLGEIAVGIAFGPVILMGIYVLLAGRTDWLPFFASLPIGFVIMNVLVINQFPDYETDRDHGKKNWVVLLGKRRSVYVYGALFALSYISCIVTAVYAANPVWLLYLLTVPIALKAVKNCYKNYNNIQGLVASNAATVTIYQLLGLSLAASAILDGLVF
jgi:1,4-dihydroxy-2-naphthoate octaprenyltransferase